MSRGHLGAAMVGAMLVGLGVVIGATVLASRPDPAPVEPIRAPSAAPESEGVRLGTNASDVDAASLRAEIASLRARIDALEQAAAEEREALAPIRNLYEAWKDSDPSLVGVDLTDPEAVAGLGRLTADSSSHGGALVGALATMLGLDDTRREAFETEVKELMEAMRELEKRHAEVKVDGDTTTIEIPAYGAEGAGLERRWEDWQSSNLSAEERDRLVKQGAAGKLFGSRLGSYDRRIEIRESGGGIRVREVATGEDGEAFQTEVQGPAMGREVVLQDYLHLLD